MRLLLQRRFKNELGLAESELHVLQLWCLFQPGQAQHLTLSQHLDVACSVHSRLGFASARFAWSVKHALAPGLATGRTPAGPPHCLMMPLLSSRRLAAQPRASAVRSPLPHSPRPPPRASRLPAAAWMPPRAAFPLRGMQYPRSRRCARFRCCLARAAH
eukprot:3935760-Rhodomonas_salina.4